MSPPTKKKTKPNSLVWEYVTITNDGKNEKSKCNFCHKLLVKSAAKLKYHIIHACTNSPNDVKRKLQNETDKWVHKQNTQGAFEVAKLISDSDGETTCSVTSMSMSSASSHSSRLPVQSQKETGYVEKSQMKQTSVRSYLDVVTTSESNRLNILIARMFYANRLPFHIVEERNFVEMVKGLRCGYTLPNRRKLSGEFLDLEYDRVMVASKSLIANSIGVTLVIDGWSNIRHDSIINFVIYTPQPVFYKSLDTGSNRHTADYLFKSKEVIEEIGSLKVTAIISDNANNMKAMWKIARSEYPHIVCFGCSAHALDLLTQDLCKLKTVNTIIDKTKSIVKEIRDSLVKYAKFKEYMKKYAALKKIKETTLSLPVITRWYSIVKMISSVIKAQTVLKQLAVDDEITLLAENRKLILDPDTGDGESFWCNLQKTHDLLKPIADGIATAESNSTSISGVPEIFFEIKEKLNQCDSLLNKQDAANTKKMISKRIDFVTTATHKLANILDPRFGGKSLSDVEKTEALSHLEYIVKLYGWDEEERLSNIFSSYFEYKQREGPFKPSLYWNKKNLENPIIWWKMFTDFSKVADLATIALRLLSVPSSSASVEREFSCQSRIHTKDRNKLTNERVQKLLAVEHNLKFLQDKNYSSAVSTVSQDQDYQEKYNLPSTSAQSISMISSENRCSNRSSCSSDSSDSNAVVDMEACITDDQKSNNEDDVEKEMDLDEHDEEQMDEEDLPLSSFITS